MKTYFNLSLKVILFFFVVSLSFKNVGFAEDCIWIGYEYYSSPSDCVFDYKYCWKGEKFIINKSSTLIFSDAANFTNIKSPNTKKPPVTFDFDRFSFKGNKNFTINISNANTISLHGVGVFNESTGEQKIELTGGSILNFLGQSSAYKKLSENGNLSKSVIYTVDGGSTLNFHNNSKTDSAKINILGGSHLNFFNDSSGENAQININDKSTLTINQKNFLGSLHLDLDSRVKLNEFSLTIGGLGNDDFLEGTIEGGKESKLIKTGIGTLYLHGDHKSFEGTSEINSGKMSFKGDLGGKVIVKSGAKIDVSENDGLTNSLGTLKAEPNSHIFLNSNSLTIGSLGNDDLLAGTIEGDANSKLIKTGIGTLHLHGDHKSFEGTSEINSGKMSFKGDLGGKVIVKGDAKIDVSENGGLTNSLGSLNAEPNSHIFLNSNSLTIGGLGNDDLLAGTIEGDTNSKLIKTGTGTLYLHGDHKSFEGTSEINSGKMSFKGDLGGTVIVKSDAKIDVSENGGFTNSLGSLHAEPNSHIFLNSNSLTIGSLGNDDLLAGAIEGDTNSKLIKTGTGTLHLHGDHKSFEGTSEINSGKMSFKGSLGGTVIVKSSAKIDVSENGGLTNSLGSLVAESNSYIFLNSNSLRIGRLGNDDLLEGTIEGDSNSKLIKTGIGTLYLHGDHKSFEGTSEINSGKMSFKGDLGGKVIVKSGAKIDVSENGGFTNSLGSLVAEPNSHIFLNSNSLRIGRLGNDDLLAGTIEGDTNSKLIKTGIGTLYLHGDHKSFEGTSEIKCGKMSFKGDLGGTVIVKSGAKIDVSENDGLTNSLGSLVAESNSHISLNSNSLTIGSVGNDDLLVGAIEGDTNSKLIKTGTGTLYLHGDHKSFEGTSEINSGKMSFEGDLGGTVIVKSGAKIDVSENDGLTNSLGSLVAESNSHISLNSNFLTIGSLGNDDLLAGAIEGDANSKLIKTGTGTLYLHGDHKSFEGASEINSGKMSIKGDLGGTVIVKSGAKIDVSENDGLTNSLGSLVAEPNSHISLNSHSLTIGSVGNDDLLAGSIEGDTNSKLIKTGTGTLYLHGDHKSFEGASEINSGKMSFKGNLGGTVTVKSGAKIDVSENGGLTNSLGSLVAESNSHIFLNSNSLTIGSVGYDDVLAGAIEGDTNSKLIKTGTGTLHLHGDHKSFEGTTEIDSGKMSFKGDLGGKVIVRGGAKIEVSENSNFTNSLSSLRAESNSHIFLNSNSLTIGSLGNDDLLAGTIEGGINSKLIKTGVGTLHLHGDHKFFEGNIEIVKGRVIFKDNLELGGNVIVKKDSRLLGSGTISKNLTIEEDGIIDLGVHDIFHVSENFQGKKGKFLLKVNKKGKCSKISIGGKGEIEEGILEYSGDQYSRDQVLCFPYEILHAKNGLEGCFKDLEPDSGNKNIKPVLEYPENKKVILKFVPDLARDKQTANQQCIAGQVEKIVNPKRKSSFNESIENLVALDEKDISHALDQISGEQYTNLITANERTTEQFIRRIYTPLRLISIDHDCDELSFNRSAVWADVEGGKSFQNGKHGYDMDEYNFTAAVQRSMNDWLTECCPLSAMIPCDWLIGWTGGLAVSYANQQYHFKHGGEAHLNDTKGALYALLTKSMCYTLFDFIVGYTSGKLERHIEFCQINHKAHGDINLFQATFYGELGLNNIYCYNIGIQPFAAIEIGYYNLSRIKEHEAGLFDLKISKHNKYLTTSYLGVHLHNFIDDNCSWGFAADIAWKHLFEFDNHLEEQFVHIREKFRIRGPKEDLNGFEGTFTIFKQINNSWLINADISGEKWANYSNFYFSIGVLFKW